MIEIQNNRYYKRKLITEGMSLYPRFKDFSKATDDLFYLNGGFNATQIVLSGSVPAEPTVGGGKLENAYLQTYCTGMTLSGTTTLPEQEVYLLQKNITGKEGGFSIGTVVNSGVVKQTGIANETGDKLAVYSAYLDPEIPWMEENFDGSNKSFGTALIQDNDRAASSIKDLYIAPEEGEDIIWAGGDAFFGGGASDDIAHNLGKYFSNPENKRVYVKPMKKNNINGLWTALYDNRNEKQKWQIYAPYWKWKDLQTRVKVGTPLPAQGANTKEMPDVSTNNTIFNDIFATQSLGSVLSTDAVSKPIFSSTVEINGEKKASGGSSLKAHHISTYTSNQKFMHNMQTSLGDKSYNPQVIKLGMWNIPKPVPLDTGGFGYAPFSGASVLSGSMSGTSVAENTEIAFGAHIADKRMSIPEINFTMNIAKMLPSPAINATRWGGNGTVYYRTVGQGDGSYTSTNPSIDSMSITAQTVAGSDNMWEESRGSLRTFWRSVVVTWSSYRAEGFNTLDDFLHYGMNRFYVEGRNDVQLGGMVFQRMFGNAEAKLSGSSLTLDKNEANIGNIYAYALPVTKWQSPTTSANGLYASGGMASFDNGKGLTMVHDPRILTEPDTSTEPHWVELPEDGWITMKMAFDTNQAWGKKTYSKNASPFEYNALHDPASAFGSAGGDEQYGRYISYGTPAMAFFDGCISGSNAGSDQLSGSLDENKPFVVMPFMVRDNGNNTGVTFTPTVKTALDGAQTFQDGPPLDDRIALSTWYNGVACPWKHSPWPSNMTIWVNGFRWTSYNGTSSSPDYEFQGVSGTIGNGVYGDVRGADSLLYESGSTAPETLVYFDDIEFKYFNNIITNHSATAGKIQQFVNFKNPTIKSPLMTRYSGSDATPVNANMLRDLNRDGNLYSRRTGHGIAIGFNGFDQMTNYLGAGTVGRYENFGGGVPAGGGTAGYTGYAYQLWNNFSTASFDNLTRMTPTAAWVTVANTGAISTHNHINTYGTGIGGWDKMGHQCWGTQWGSNGVARVPPIPDTTAANGQWIMGDAGAYQYTSNASTTPSIHQSCWQGASMWYNGASGSTLYSGGKYFHGESGTSDAWWGDDLRCGRAWMTISSGALGDVASAPTAAEYRLPSQSKRLYSGHTFYVGYADKGEAFGSTDGFTQKGFTTMAIDMSTGSSTQTGAGSTSWKTDDGSVGDFAASLWAKRENIWASAKILAVPGMPGLNMADDEAELDNNAIIVDNPGILLPDEEDCEYIIYRAGAGINVSGANNIYAGTVDDDSGGSNTILKICKLAMNKSNAQGTEGVIYFDTPMTNLSSWELSELWISPYKYWVNLSFVDTNNGDYSTSTFFPEQETTAVLNYPRNYESIMQINERFTGSGPDVFADAVGSTYNESTYSYDDTASQAGVRGLITKPWILEAGAESTSLVVDKDFGFGTYDDDENEGGQLGKAAVVLNTYNDIELKGLVDSAGVAPDEDINLVLGLSNQVAAKTVSLVGDENSAALDEAFLPAMVWQFHDELPQISKFSVSPAFDALQSDVNLYELTKENVNNIKFDWSESGDDVWYRMLMVDNKNIPDKYANAFFWAPLNVSSSTIGSAPALNEYDMSVTPRQYPDSGTALTVGTSVRTKIDGLSGYTAYTASSSTGTISAASQMEDLTEYTLCAHFIPSSDDKGTHVWLISEGGADTATNGFGIKLHNGNVIAYTSGASATSTSLIACDGETPLSVIVTYKSGSKIGPDFKLYINGALEDYILSPDPCNSGGDDFVIGGTGTTGTYGGSVEEIVIYNKAIPIIESDSEYLYNPSELTEVVTSASTEQRYVTQHARLFLMDYHNIRGLNRKQVASSNQVSWKVTTL